MTSCTSHRCEGTVDEDVPRQRLQLENDEVEGKGRQCPDHGNDQEVLAELFVRDKLAQSALAMAHHLL